MSFALFCIAGCTLASAAHADVRILHVEPIAIVSDAVVRKNGTEARTLKFDALGRRFDLRLENNSQLNKLAADQGSSALALRGSLASTPNSWARLTHIDGRLSGLIWDGNELFAIEPDDKTSGTVIFRLADTVTDPNTLACASDESMSGAKLYERIGVELKAADAQISHRLSLSALMDAEFRQRYASHAEAADAAIARLNNLDGIFAAQVGVTVEMTHLAEASLPVSINLTGSTSANALLSSLSSARAGNATLYSTGMTHLFTGRDLEGNTIGLAYIGAVCDQRYGASLSESRDRGVWLDSLIAAHELGHSFGASHDGVGECAATPIGYLMSPSIAGWDQFSQCSLNRMRATMSQATCLTTMPRGDISMAAQLGSERATLDQEFAWALQVTNIGNAPIESGLVYINVPGALTVTSTSTSNGSCTFGAGIVECALSDLAPNDSRTVELRMRGMLTGNFGISATVSAMGDANLDNNAGAGSVTIDPQTPTPAPGTAPQPTPTASAPEQAPASGGGAVHLWMVLALAMTYRARQNRP